MRTCVVEISTGMVLNVIAFGLEDAINAEIAHVVEDTQPPEGCVFIASEVAGPGWLCTDLVLGTFVDPAKRAPTSDEVKAMLEGAVQVHLDTAAHARGYDDIFTAVTYADEPAVPQFQTEGRAYRQWRSLVWAHCIQALADVQAGKRVVPSAEELIAELPVLKL